MPNFQTITATFAIVTPMFLGGAEGQAEGVRLASLKGALRFWWRALRYPDLHVDQQRSGADAAMVWRKALDELRKEEMRLFGSTAAQAQMLMRLKRPQILQKYDKDEPLMSGPKYSGARYLGYGVVQTAHKRADEYAGTKELKQGQLLRSALSMEQEFEVNFYFKPKFPDDLFRSFLKALLVFGMLGGMGSCARRAYGSVALVSLIDKVGKSYYEPPRTGQEYADRLVSIIGRNTGSCTPVLEDSDLPPFTAFSRFARIDSVEVEMDALGTLNVIGKELQWFRSYGYYNQKNSRYELDGTVPHQNFPDDHDFAANPKFCKTRVPERIAFGMPHNYDKYKISVVPSDGTNDLDRRASPILFHVHPLLGSERHLAVVTILPAMLAPINKDGKSQVSVLDTSSKPPRRVGGVRHVQPNWSILYEFLDGRTNPKDGKNRNYFNTIGPNHQTILSGKIP